MDGRDTTLTGAPTNAVVRRVARTASGGATWLTLKDNSICFVAQPASSGRAGGEACTTATGSDAHLPYITLGRVTQDSADYEVSGVAPVGVSTVHVTGTDGVSHDVTPSGGAFSVELTGQSPDARPSVSLTWADGTVTDN